MAILIRNKESGNWVTVDSAPYGNEKELQKMLLKSPSIIPLNEISEQLSSPLVVAIPEFGLPGSGNTDFIAFTAEGDIALIECKLDANAEVKRKVIGQVLEYAAYLWQTTYDEIDQQISNRMKKSLADLVGEKARAENPDWDEEMFRDNVKEALKTGSFILIIAVDKINEELSKTISFLNGCGTSSFSFHALEMQRYEKKELSVDVLVPHLHGKSTVKPTLGERKKWTEEELKKTIQEQHPQNIADLMIDLYEWSKANADNVFYGTGKQTGSYTFHYRKDDRTISVFSVYTHGKMTLNYGNIGPELTKNLRPLIDSIPSFVGLSRDSGWPAIMFSKAFGEDPKALTKFKDAVLQFGKIIHNKA